MFMVRIIYFSFGGEKMKGCCAQTGKGERGLLGEGVAVSRQERVE